MTFACTFLLMFASREFVIPAMNLQAKNGNLDGDPQVYSDIGLLKAQEMKVSGLSQFQLRPGGFGPAGAASLSYYYFDSVYGVVVLNAFLHSIMVVSIFSILSMWFGLLASASAIILVFFSPYMMVWFSQVNKDSYVAAGSLLLIFSVLKMLKQVKDFPPAKNNNQYNNFFKFFLIAAFGVLLIALVRPYINKINFMLFASWYLVTICSKVYRKSISYNLCFILILVCMMLTTRGSSSDETIESFRNYTNGTNNVKFESTIIYEKCLNNISMQTWENNFFVDFINANMKAMSGQRCLIFTILSNQKNNVTLDSVLDYDILPRSTLEALAYAPRAALLGIFAPWPDRWLYVFENRFSTFYIIAPIEAFLMYVGLLALGFFVYLRRIEKLDIVFPFFISFGVMSFYGFSTPYLGALYRYRYPWWMLVVSMGLAALVQLIIIYCKRSATITK